MNTGLSLQKLLRACKYSRPRLSDPCLSDAQY
jgi:hypothetical protein